MHQTISEILQKAGAAVRDHVYSRLQAQDITNLSTVYREAREDTIFLPFDGVFGEGMGPTPCSTT